MRQITNIPKRDRIDSMIEIIDNMIIASEQLKEIIKEILSDIEGSGHD